MFKKQGVASLLDVPDFVQLLRDAVYVEDCERVHAACDRVEEFLSRAGTEMRDMLAVEMFESFQNAESPSGSDTSVSRSRDEAPLGGTRSHLENVRQAGFAGSDGVGRGSIDFAAPVKFPMRALGMFAIF